MKDKNIVVAKAQALGAMAFVMNAGFEHVTLKCSNVEVSLTVYCDTLGGLVLAKSMLRPFLTDGCSLKDDYLSESETYFLEIEWPFPYYNAR